MQIRIGNKQDESACRELAESCADEAGISFALDSSDSDLKNIEANYLGRDGIFLVAEEEEQVIAFAVAARAESDEVCALSRVLVAASRRRKGIGRKLVAQIIFFARNLDYRQLRMRVELKPAEESAIYDAFLRSLGFAGSESEAAGSYVKDLAHGSPV